MNLQLGLWSSKEEKTREYPTYILNRSHNGLSDKVVKIADLFSGIGVFYI